MPGAIIALPYMFCLFVFLVCIEHVQQRWRWSIGNVQLLFYGKYGDLPLAQQIGVIGGGLCVLCAYKCCN